VNADCYYSGSLGRNYMRVQQYENVGIEVNFSKFEMRQYRENAPFEPFTMGCGLADYLNIKEMEIYVQ
jgi:hypothetical protein